MSEAENLLHRLTHNSTNVQIANAVQVSGEALYRLHLPADVQSRMPYNIQSSAIGDPYDFLTVGEVLEFVFDCLVWIGTTLYNLAEMVYEAGVKFICQLTNSVLNAIQETVTKIVKAFQAFSDWAVEFVCDTVSTGGLDLEGIWSGAVERPASTPRSPVWRRRSDPRPAEVIRETLDATQDA